MEAEARAGRGGGPRRLGARRPTALALAFALLAACGGEPREAAPLEEVNPLLRPARLTEQAPPTYRARFETSAGGFTVEVHRDWAPLGADRFYNLVKHGFYDDTRVYRVVSGFMAQFGISGDPVLNAVWQREAIVDDTVKQSNTRGRITFATAGRHTRTTELFINYGDNSFLDDQWFAPFGEVVEGMEGVDAFHAGYGETVPMGTGPYAAMAMARGNEYLDADFPELTRIVRVEIVPDP